MWDLIRKFSNKKIFTIIIFGAIFLLPTNVFAVTVSYYFENDTILDHPFNTTLLYGGIHQVLNDATLGKSMQMVKTGSTRADVKLDAIPTTAEEIDISFKIKDGQVNKTDRPGVLVFANSGGTQGYLVQWDNTVSDRLEIHKRSTGSPYTDTQLTFSGSYPTTTSKLWRVTASSAGGVATITAYTWNGSSWVQFLQYVDSSSPYLSGGVTFSTVSPTSALVIDNVDVIYSGSAIANSITVDSPERYLVYQRDGTNVGDIVINGSYTGTPTAIESSWDGGAYETIVASPSGGIFTGTMADKSPEQGTLIVRFTNDTGTSTSILDIGIGDVYMVAGQSNAVGRGQNANSDSHASLKATVFRQDEAWKRAIDPTDLGTDMGSAWPLLATQLMADQNVPVAFITTAEGGSGLVQPQDWLEGGSGDDDYEAAMEIAARSRVNEIKAILWYQGESDVGYGTSQSTYYSALQALVANFASDFPGNPLTVIAQLSYQDTANHLPELNGIRLAQKQAWGLGGNFYRGPTLYDLGPHSDGVHIYTDSDMQKHANRWWASLEDHFYGGSNSAGPQLVSAERSSDGTLVTLTFSDGDLPLQPATNIGGFRLKNNGTPVSITSATRVGDSQIEIVPASAVTGTVTISLGEDNDGTGQAVPKDNSSFSLPADFFIDQTVSVDSGTPGVTISESGGSTDIVEGGATDSYGVFLETQPTGSVIITPSPDADASVNPTTLTFTTSDWATPQTVVVTAVNDAFVEGDHTATITHSASSSDGNYNNISIDDVVANVTDNDVADTIPPNVSVDVIPTPTSNQSPLVTGTATDATNTVLTVQYQVDSTVGSWSACSATDGTFDEASETFECQTSSIASGSHTVYVRSTDSESNTSSAEASNSFVIDVAPPTASSVSGSPTSPSSVDTITISGTATDALTTVSDVEYQVDSSIGAWISCIATDGTFDEASDSFSCSIGALSAGNHSIYLKLTDEVSNETSSFVTADIEISVSAVTTNASGGSSSGSYIIKPTNTPVVIVAPKENTSPCSNCNPFNLKSGDNKPEVVIVQRIMNLFGFSVSISGPGSPGSETTFFGPKTKAAMEKFQLESGVVDSVADPNYGTFDAETLDMAMKLLGM